jgi:iron complex transport system ATP-binding protein
MLSVEQVRVSRRGVSILDGATLSIRPGEVLGLLGANGAGKSTLLAALAGELCADAGHILLDGAALATMPHPIQARRRAVLPQKPALSFDLSVNEVVAMGAYPFPELSSAQVWTLACRALALADVAHLAGRRYATLSGGEQQRVQFARVLVQCLAPAGGPTRYLLLDEPTASLDPRHQIEVLRVAAVLAHEAGIGVLVVLHDINLAARWCDRLALLAEGRLAAVGEPARVLTENNLRFAYGAPARVVAHPWVPGRVLVLFDEEGA